MKTSRKLYKKSGIVRRVWLDNGVKAMRKLSHIDRYEHEHRPL